MRRLLPGLVVVALLGISCAALPGDGEILRAGPAKQKVVIIGIPAITWEDLDATSSPFLSELISKSAIANVSVRVSNEPADTYATLGAGVRTESDPSAGWFFNADEQVENGTGREVWRRREEFAAMTPPSQLFLATIRQLIEGNEAGTAFGAVPGRLGVSIIDAGGQTAAIGNADLSIGPLPAVLPSTKMMQSSRPPEVGIHREAALAVMHPHGTVNRGDVSRALLRKDPSTAFGISTDPDSLLSTFRAVFRDSSLVVVETGDTARIDLYTQGQSDLHRELERRATLKRVLKEQVGPLVEEAGARALLLIIAPSTPGGREERGQLRPVIISGPGIPAGIASSQSTGRPGLITLPDITATIAKTLRLDGFDDLHEIRVSAGSPNAAKLAQQNERAVVHDAIRAPISFAIILLHLALYVVAVARLRRGPLASWLAFLLLVAMAFPIASFVTILGFWKLGVGASIASIVVAALLLGGASFGRARPEPAAAAILGLTTIFFFLDLVLGAPAQLDSVLGYTSVAAGRFYGLGNLGFALFAASTFLIAAIVGDGVGQREPSRIWRWVPVVIVTVALIWIGHPRLGDDVGGVLTMVPAIFAFVWAYFSGGRVRVRHVVLIGIAALFAVLAFGLIDLLRPGSNRTHLGQFLVDVSRDPSTIWFIARRKLSLAITLTFAARWGLAVPGAIAVLFWLYRRARGTFKEMLVGRDGLRAGLHGVFVAAVVGSLANDSGLAVAGMILAIATPWALLRASASEIRPAS